MSPWTGEICANIYQDLCQAQGRPGSLLQHRHSWLVTRIKSAPHPSGFRAALLISLDLWLESLITLLRFSLASASCRSLSALHKYLKPLTSSPKASSFCSLPVKSLCFVFPFLFSSLHYSFSFLAPALFPLPLIFLLPYFHNIIIIRA